jgi:hypothetical protein
MSGAVIFVLLEKASGNGKDPVMGLSICATLLLLGTWAVLTALLNGDRFRRRGGSVVPLPTPRILVALTLLGSAGVVGLVGVAGEPAGKVYPAYGALALLALGVATAVAALRRAPGAEGEEASQPRITKQGWTALALLSSAQVVGVLNDRVVDTVNRLQGPAGGHPVVPGALGLFFLVLGTGGAVCMFLARNTAAGDSTPQPRRITPRPRWTLAVLGLAVAALVLTHLIFPTPAGMLGLVLLILGIGAGLFGYLFDDRARSPGQPVLLRISPRGWVALVLLVLATGVLALAQARAWIDRKAVAEGVEEAAPEKALVELRAELARKEAELRSASTRPADGRSWDHVRGPDEAGGPIAGEDGAARRLQEELDQLREKLSRLEAGQSDSQSALFSPPAPTVDLATYKWTPGPASSQDRARADRARRAALESDVAQLRAKVTRMDAEANKVRPAPSPATPARVDLADYPWNGRRGRPDAGGTVEDHREPAVTGRKGVRD